MKIKSANGAAKYKTVKKLPPVSFLIVTGIKFKVKTQVKKNSVENLMLA